MFNKKGTTLAEVIISIALISVVLVFMIKMLLDLNNMETNSTYASDNQIKRSEILRTIGNDLNNKTIVAINDNNSNGNTLNINFRFNDGTNSTISSTREVFSYTDSAGETRRWTIEGGFVYVNRANVYYMADSKTTANKLYAITIDIEIHTINERNDVNHNNTLDDIIISYMGNQTDYATYLSCLGCECDNTCN